MPNNVSMVRALTSNESRESGFIGRQKELAVLTTALNDALAGRGQMVMLAGEPGIGKTRLAQELASLSEQRGARVFWGWCYERQGAPPYWPWLQLIRPYVDETEADRLRGEMGAGASDIAEILPELRTKLVGLEPPHVSVPEQARFQLFFSITAFLKKLSQVQPLVLMLDDLHWADESSLHLLEFLVHEINGSRILVIGAYRETEITGRHPLTETLGSLVRHDNFSRVQLGGLNSQEVGELIMSKSGVAAREDAVVALHQRTDGNPLFVGEVVGSVSKEQLAGNLDWTDRIPGGVRDVIARGLSGLSESCVALLETASVIGRDFEFGLLRTLNPDLSQDTFSESLDDALAVSLIEPSPEGPSRYRFSHALVQQAVYQEISSTRKMQCHAAIGEALERLHQSDREAHAAEFAHHFAEAGALGSPEKVIEYSLIAGEYALDSFEYEQALGHFTRVLDAKGQISMDGEKAQALFGLGRAEATVVSVYELKTVHQNLGLAFDYYDSVGDTARAVAVASEFPSPPGGDQSQESQRRIARALELVHDDSLEAGILHSVLGHFQGVANGDYPSARDSFVRALTIARRKGNVNLEIKTLNHSARIDWHHLQFDDSLKNSLTATNLAVSALDPRGEVTARYYTCMSSHHLGDSVELHRQASAILEPAERLRDRFWLATAYFCISLSLSLQGDWQLAREANQLGLDVLPLDPRLLVHRAILEAQAGDRQQAENRLERLEEEALRFRSESGANAPNALLALSLPLANNILGKTGQSDVGNEFAAAVISSNSTNPFYLTFAKVGASLLALDGPSEASATYYTALKPLAGHMFWFISVDRCLGLLAGNLGDQDSATAHFQDASDFCRKSGYRPELAWTIHDHAKSLLVRNGPGDKGKAAALQAEAESIATELRMLALLDRLAALQEDAAAVPPKSPGFPSGLTQREVEVLRLICDGKTDREIGQELFISIKTVGNHVSNILNKTGAANRTDATSYAHTHGLVGPNSEGQE